MAMARGSGIAAQSIGKKALMGVSGLLLLGFVFGHMVGNLKVFQGAESFNNYAEFIREVGYPVVPHYGFLWIARLGLLALVVTHVVMAIQLAGSSRAARTHRYKKYQWVGDTYASRTMRWGGIIIALFVIYHLLHFTGGQVHSDFIAGDAYHNLVVGFSNPIIVAAYFLAITALCFHLYHGVWSALQTLGVAGERIDRVRRPLASSLAAILWVGFLIVPTAVLAGWIVP